MGWVTEDFMTKWRSGRHVGRDKPVCVVQVRRGNWRRAYRDWDEVEMPIGVEIPGEPANIETTDEWSGAVSIPDDSPTGATVTFSLDAVDVVLGMKFFIEHTYVSDLVITLTPPSGTAYTLCDGHGGSGDNLGTTTHRWSLKDDASRSVTSMVTADAPFDRDWRPETLLLMIPPQVAGDWVVKVEDTAGSDLGTIRYVSLTTGAGEAGFWYPVFTETTEWEDVPNVKSVNIVNDLDQRGMAVATVVMDNVAYVQQTGPGGDYHDIQRGYYAPYRGLDEGSYMPPSPVESNAWTGKLDEQADMRIWMGFGEPERTEGAMPLDGGTNGCWVFHGLVDDVDPESLPAQLTLTARVGKTLTDQRVFGWVKSKQLKDPVTFMDSIEHADEESSTGFVMKAGAQVIVVTDVSEMVKVALRWAGFQEWEIEEAGVRLNGRFVVNRASYLIDIIQAACDQTGFEFFVADPTDGDSIGVPTFRRNSATLREPGAIAVDLKDTDLLTDMRGKLSQAPRAYIIRVRGKEARSWADPGSTLGGDSARRVMAVYRPPWTQDNTMAGIIKHVTHTDFRQRTVEACLAACYLIAIEEALAAATAAVSMPGLPLVELDDQVRITDVATGFNSRLWVRSSTTDFVPGEKTTWTTSISGALIDTPDLNELIAEAIIAFDDPTVSPVASTGTRFRRIR